MSLSKFLFASFPYNCYEIGHTWSPHCCQSWFGIWYDVFVRALKLYGLLYLVGQLVSRRYNRKAFFNTFKNTLKSSMFISSNFYFYLFFVCFGNKVLGRLYLAPATFLAGFFSALVAIHVEKPGRRRMLALYMLNLASDMVYRLLHSRGLVPYVPYSEVVTFASCVGSYVYYARKHGYYDDPVPFVLKYLLGPDELKSAKRQLESSTDKGLSVAKLLVNDVNGNDEIKNGVVPSDRKRRYGQTRGSFRRIVTVTLKSGTTGWTIGAVVSLVSSLKSILKGSRPVTSLLTSSSARRMGFFFASLTGLYTLTSGLLERVCGERQDWHGLVAGSAAGLAASSIMPNSNISLYLAWKLIELVYLKSAEEKLVPSFDHAPALLYSLCTGLMLYVAIVEPHNLRPQYLKFLDEISGHMVRQINRYPLDILGLHSSRTFPDFFPFHLDRRFISKQFFETVLIWM
ncbi:transmembrane protein 135-like [Ornithodoros turicata]|uniref:transmembrane protein 135-like n=1 Tax=Ornithodoros turicata TaxID=34597 RepID=UPI00313A2ABB